MKIIERNLQEIGKSLLVTLPKAWTTALKLKKGSKVKLTISEQGILTIAPEISTAHTKKESLIELDEYFARRFFKEYFQGDDRIVFAIPKKGSIDRKTLYTFLQKFMNAQIIEDSDTKVVVKCFKIDDLTIQECLSRMFFLSVSMFDDVANNSTKLKDVDDTITRFYYMLVMQIRRYLSEGRYTQDNNMKIIDAMDYRMVAEKIERVADTIKSIEYDADLDLHLKEVREFYFKCIQAFMNHNYDEALNLMILHKKLVEKFQASLLKYENKKDICAYKNISKLLSILWYSRDVSMLVR